MNVINWGASAKLVGNDTQAQAEVLEMLGQGVHVEACKDCCEKFGVTTWCRGLLYGETLTGYLKAGEKILTI